jgi:anti-sigma factor RsiW
MRLTLRRRPAPIACQELVELVTDYLEDALPAAERARFEAHIAACEHCATYVDQIRLTVAAAGTLTESDLRPEVRDELLAAFRDWNAAGA